MRSIFHNKITILILLVFLVLSFQVTTEFLMGIFFNLNELYDRVGPLKYSDIWDCFSLIVPLLLVLTSPRRSGLILGHWRENYKRTLAVMLIPIVLTFIFYRYTSQPFQNLHIGFWLVSPLAQDLLGNYMFGVLDEKFLGQYSFGKIFFKQSLLLIAILASLWHVGNLFGMQPSFVLFQLFYTFIFAFIVYYTRIWTGSILPVLLTHVSVNFIVWLGI